MSAASQNDDVNKPVLSRWLSFGRGESAGAVLLAAAFEADPAAVMLADADGRPVRCNPAWARLIGGALPPDRLLVEDRAAQDALGRIARAARNGVPVSERFRVAGDPVRWFDIAAHGIAGQPGAIAWRIVDATADAVERHSERQERERIGDLVDHAPVGLYSADADGRLLYANQTFADWLGRSMAELGQSGVRLADLLATSEVPEVLREPKPAAPPVTAALKLKSAQGAALPVNITQNAGRDAAGRVHTRSVVGDLSQELHWRDSFRVVEEHFHRFFDLAPIGILTVDAAGTILEANASFRRTAGARDVAGERLIGLLRSDDGRNLAERFAEAMRGEALGGAVDVRFTAPPERSGQLFFSRLDDAKPGSAALLLHFLDTTEQKNLEVQFAQSQKMQAVGQLAGGIAHDFNNLLTAMIGFSDLLLTRHQPGDESFADIMQIKQNANRAANLVRQLLAFSRQQTLRPKVLDITDVLADLRNLLSRLIGENMELKMQHGRDVGLVKVDQGQFEQVIINLAVNARDAMAGGGTLTIRTANIAADESVRLGHELMPAGEYVLIEVSDTGKGIPKEILGKIFEPFFTTKEVGAGTGLGLSTVYGIIKQTGGFIFPESTPGAGAVFRIYLPRHQAAAEADGEAVAAASRASRDLTGKGTILLVEDEDAVRTFAARALRNKGYTVLEANSGESALKLVDSVTEPVDLLISDVVMPNMDGPTLVKNVRERRPTLKIIFISGYAEDAFRKTMEGPGEIAFLPKPFSLGQLAGKVKEVLRDEA